MTDAAALAATHARAFDTERPWSATEFDALLSQKGVVLTGDAGCFVLARVVLDEAEILTLATTPSEQRKGMASAVLATFAGVARQQGVKTMFLEVAADNVAALALYRRAGFFEVGQRPAYYVRKNGPAADAVIMKRHLGPE